MNIGNVAEIIKKHSGSDGGLIAILEEIQDEYGYLPENALRAVAGQAGYSLVDVCGVATFYKAFRLKPRGKHMITVCLGTACHVNGSSAVVSEFERNLDIAVGETTEDKEFTLETVNCLGSCVHGPIVVIDGHYFSRVTKLMAPKLIEKAREGLDRIDVEKDRTVFPIEVTCPHCGHSLMDPDNPIDGHPSIRITASFKHKHGWVRLSCLYGSYNAESEHEIPDKAVVQCLCPHCDSDLTGAASCRECAAPMIVMTVRGGGIAQVCSRHGCRAHSLELDDLVT